jgi:hypothetical protein
MLEVDSAIWKGLIGGTTPAFLPPGPLLVVMMMEEHSRKQAHLRLERGRSPARSGHELHHSVQIPLSTLCRGKRRWPLVQPTRNAGKENTCTPPLKKLVQHFNRCSSTSTCTSVPDASKRRDIQYLVIGVRSEPGKKQDSVQICRLTDNARRKQRSETQRRFKSRCNVVKASTGPSRLTRERHCGLSYPASLGE